MGLGDNQRATVGPPSVPSSAAVLATHGTSARAMGRVQGATEGPSVCRISKLSNEGNISKGSVISHANNIMK